MVRLAWCRGATAYELQVGRLWVGIYRRRFRPCCGLGFIRCAPKDD